jgi:tetratricopeptide (TPR) repeat protein
MRLRTLFAILILLGGSRAQASTLKGVVIENEQGGPPVANVRVSAADGANPTVTRSDGTFILEFPQKQPGETIQLIVQKEGYVVINDIQLERVLPTDAAAKPLTLLLCRKGDREEMARRFYRLKSFETIEESYMKRLKELEETQRASAATVEELRRERDQARSAAGKAADELAKEDPSKTSELYRDAMRFFLEGKIQEGINVLNDEELNRLLTTAREREAEASKAIAQAALAWTLKAQLLTLQFRFDEAERAHKAAIKASPESFEANFAYGAFNQELNRYDQAEAAYGKCLKLARELAQKNPERYLPDVARTLNDLGILDRDQNRMDEARQTYEEALKTYRELAQKNPETYLPGVAMTLNNLGNLESDQNRMGEARQAYEEALKIRRQLAQKNPETYLPDVAMTLNNLGNLDRAQNRLDEARQALEEALKTYRELAQKNPEAYLPYVALTLNNLGILDRAQNRTEEARQALEEARAVYQRLAQRDPERFQGEVARLNSLLETLTK